MTLVKEPTSATCKKVCICLKSIKILHLCLILFNNKFNPVISTVQASPLKLCLFYSIARIYL